MDGMKLLDRARKAGFDVKAQDGQLIVKGNDEQLAQQLLEHKAELLAILDPQPDEPPADEPTNEYEPM